MLLGFLIAGCPVRADENGSGRGIDQGVVGDTAALLEQGELEITIGGSYEDDSELETFELTVQIEYGVTDWLEVAVELPYQFLYPRDPEDPEVDGTGDITVSASVALPMPESLSASFTLGVVLPRGDEKKDLGDGVVIWEPSLAIDVPLGDCELVFDIGGELGPDNEVFVYEVTIATETESELVVSLGVQGCLDGDEQPVSIVPGFGFPIMEDVELGVEIPIGLNRETPDWQIVVEVTLEY